MKWGKIVSKSFPLLLGILLIAYFTSGLGAIPEALVAYGTILLAYATYRLGQISKEQNDRLIAENREKENRDRKERFLNEVLDWLNHLEDQLFRSRLSRPIAEAIKEEMEDRQKGLDVRTIGELEVLDSALSDLGQIEDSIRCAEYFSKLASYLDKDNLYFTIKDILKLLGDRLDLQKQSSLIIREKQDADSIRKQVELAERLGGVEKLFEMDIASLGKAGVTPGAIMAIRLGKNAGEIRKASSIAIDRAIKLKAELL